MDSFFLHNFLIDMSQFEVFYPKEYTEILEYFKREYYQHANIVSHIDYIEMIYMYKQTYGIYPSREEFFMMCKRECFCEFYTTDQEYLIASEFFMRECGELLHISCAHFSFLNQFYTIEHRYPTTISEFTGYLRLMAQVEIDPNLFMNMETHSKNPVNKTKIDLLRDGMCIAEEIEEICSICQESIKNGQKYIKLDCGHYYHSQDGECCENGTIFKWFETNNECPVCRKIA